MKLAELLRWASDLAGCDEIPADSQVYVEAAKDVSRVLFGVDISLAEIMWAQQEKFDAVIAHHPLGDSARINFSRVVWRQVDQMKAEGINEEVARRAVESRITPVERAIHTSNVNALVDTARLTGMPLANIHLPCDILGRNSIIETLKAGGSGASVADSIQDLRKFPEIAHAPVPPQVWLGSDKSLTGRWTVAMAGGTNGGYPVFREYFNAGVDTIFAMHIAEDDLKRLSQEFPHGRNLVVTGHMGTDSIGINQVIAGMESKGVSVVRTSGVVPPR